MKIIEYIKNNTWCDFKNNNRTLFYRSIYTYGIHKYKHKKITNCITEDITVYFPNNEKQVRGFNGIQPMISEKSIKNFCIKDIDKFINEYYKIRKQIEEEEQKVKKDVLKVENIRKVIELEAQVYSYEYLISGLGNNFDLESNKNIATKFYTWRNDPNNTRLWIYDSLFSDFVKKYNLSMDPFVVERFISFQELLDFLEGKISNTRLTYLIKKRQENGFVFLNFNDRKWKNRVIMSKSIVNEVGNIINCTTNKKLEEAISSNTLEGKPTFSFPILQGECVVLQNTSRPSDVLNKIVVCSVLTAQSLYELLDAKCIIVDHGGFLSHAAICSREYLKPCIIGCEIATSFFKTGDVLQVDGNSGKITLLKK